MTRLATSSVLATGIVLVGALFASRPFVAVQAQAPLGTVTFQANYKAPRTADDLECPHGVQFYDIAQGTVRSPRAAWSYEAPRERMKPVDHWIGFWEDVEIR